MADVRALIHARGEGVEPDVAHAAAKQRQRARQFRCATGLDVRRVRVGRLRIDQRSTMRARGASEPRSSLMLGYLSDVSKHRRSRGGGKEKEEAEE